jgi:hypothetical protein
MNARLVAYAVLLLAIVGGVAGGCGRDSEPTTKTITPAASPSGTPTYAGAETTDVARRPATADNSPAQQHRSTAAPRRPVTATAPPTEPTRCAGPTVVGVTTTPALPITDGWLNLPDAAGTVTFSVRATAANEVQFHLTPTGTETASLASLLGTDRTPRDGFTLTWSYPNQALLSHFSVLAIGPCGRAETSPFNIYHD